MLPDVASLQYNTAKLLQNANVPRYESYFEQSAFPASSAVGVTTYSVISKLLSQFLCTTHIALFIFLAVIFRLSYYVFSQRRQHSIPGAISPARVNQVFGLLNYISFIFHWKCFTHSNHSIIMVFQVNPKALLCGSMY